MEETDPNMQLQPTEGDAEADPEAMEKRAAEKEAQRKLLEELRDFKVRCRSVYDTLSQQSSREPHIVKRTQCAVPS